ncbi:MAG: CarD family transcriptional regulator [Deltaproteobacteria bacterium]|nr:CarD family transcriptional regulator [Deltaproteobacteria bacterium]
MKVDPAKAEIRVDEGEFKVGETVVYPARGVADIVAVEDKEIGGRRQSFYVLRVHDTEQKILVPVNNAAQIGLRRPISEAQVREIFRILKVTDVPLDTQTWNRRYRGFVEKLATGSVFAVAEVLRDLSRVKIVKDGLSFSERQMLERARGLIVKEIAVARAKPEDAVRQQIEAIFA